MRMKALYEQEHGGFGRLITVCRTRLEFDAACDVHCSGFREDNAIVREVDSDDPVIASFLAIVEAQQ